MNNYYQPQFQNPYGMYGFQQPTGPVMKPVQPLTQDEINHLKTQVNDLTNVALTPDEILKAKCTHKYKDGSYSLIPLDPENPANGDVVCEICGATFNLNQMNEDTVQSAIAVIKNAMQQTKTFWYDVPNAVTTEYMLAEPLLGKLPNLYKVAIEHGNRYINSTNGGMQQVGYYNGGYGSNAFDIANGFTQNMYGCYMQPQQPMYYQQPQAPMGGQPMYQQPQMGMQPQMMYPQQQQPMMGQPVYQPQQSMMGQPMYPQQQPMMAGMGMGGNPFGYECTQCAPQQAPAGQAPAQPAVVPQQAAPAGQAPAQPAAPTQTVEVNKNFSL